MLACTLFNQASEQYRQAVALSPGNPAIYNNLGNALLLEGNLEEAAYMLGKTLLLRPVYADAKSNRESVYKALDNLVQNQEEVTRGTRRWHCETTTIMLRANEA